jgi:hypothetical protein
MRGVAALAFLLLAACESGSESSRSSTHCMIETRGNIEMTDCTTDRSSSWMRRDTP